MADSDYAFRLQMEEALAASLSSRSRAPPLSFALMMIKVQSFETHSPHSPDNRALARECKDVKLIEYTLVLVLVGRLRILWLQLNFCMRQFYVLEEFDEGKRSFRRRLAGHNEPEISS
ncbi:unnamed protein product [Eruca vesicaria subsp. sativa]|uniref:Uncharacterized protein n=1 Tax=Eruca vesicaria subsp. sativa TaxID=29727 RepID=A0ABC8JHT2_ERUVS|nr:unnamed protein product [Eruca vesicaria subsp. sativa]